MQLWISIWAIRKNVKHGWSGFQRSIFFCPGVCPLWFGSPHLSSNKARPTIYHFADNPFLNYQIRIHISFFEWIMERNYFTLITTIFHQPFLARLSWVRVIISKLRWGWWKCIEFRDLKVADCFLIVLFLEILRVCSQILSE